MREVDLVVIMSEFHGEGQRVKGVRRGHGSLLSWIVLDLMPSTMPAHASRFCLFLAVDERLHSMVVEAVGLDQVDYVELVYLILSRIRNAEVEPLAELRGAPVIELQVQVVLKLAYLGRSVQITALEARLKEQGCIVRTLQVVVLIQAVEVASVDHLAVLERCSIST